MFKKSLLTFLAVWMAFSAFCLQGLQNTNFKLMPTAKAETIVDMAQKGCDGQKKIGSQMNCCLNHSNQDAKSNQINQADQTYKKVIFLGGTFNSTLSDSPSKRPAKITHQSCEQNKSPPSLTGMIIKNE